MRPLAASCWRTGRLRRAMIRCVTSWSPPAGQNVATWPTRSCDGSSIRRMTTASPASNDPCSGPDIEPDVTMSRRWPLAWNHRGTASEVAYARPQTTMTVHRAVRSARRPFDWGVACRGRSGWGARRSTAGAGLLLICVSAPPAGSAVRVGGVLLGDERQLQVRGRLLVLVADLLRDRHADAQVLGRRGVQRPVDRDDLGGGRREPRAG